MNEGKEQSLSSESIGNSNLPGHVLPSSTTEALERIRKVTKELIHLANNGINSETTLYTSYMDYSFRYETEFVHKVDSGTVSLSEIMNYPGTPLNDPLNYPGYWHDPEKWNPGVNLMMAVMSPHTLKLLNLPANQLTRLWNLQMGEDNASSRDPNRRQEYLRSGGYRNFRGKVRWGAIHEASFCILNYDGREPITREFCLQTVTTVPHLLYECRFGGSLRNGFGELYQKLIIVPNIAYITSGWNEWLSNAQSKLPDVNSRFLPPA